MHTVLGISGLGRVAVSRAILSSVITLFLFWNHSEAEHLPCSFLGVLECVKVSVPQASSILFSLHLFLAHNHVLILGFPRQKFSGHRGWGTGHILEEDCSGQMGILESECGPQKQGQ